MKNIKSFEGDAFDFYKKVRSKKKDNKMKERLATNDTLMRTHFETFDRHFADNSLELMSPTEYTDPLKADMRSLYNYNSITLSKLRVQLTTTETGRVIKCPQCTINTAHTFDHIVPQGEFVEFCVHPRNLMCSCGDCNGRKNKIWRLNGSRIFLNLYLDQLPPIQYLFVETHIGNKAIDVRYYLDNRNKIAPALFALIKEHYKRLNLFERYAEESDTVISSLRDTLEIWLKETNDAASIKLMAINFEMRQQISKGTNYWQSVLKLALLNDEDFMIDYK